MENEKMENYDLHWKIVELKKIISENNKELKEKD